MKRQTKGEVAGSVALRHDGGEIRIVKVEPFLLHVPVTGGHIADSLHSISHWGAPGVILHTDSGLRGYGYVGTHAHLELDRLITHCIAKVYGPLLQGESALDTQRLWLKLSRFSPAQWVGRAGITQLALSAIDTALWDLKAKACGLPLWRLLGGDNSGSVQVYNTDGGWVSLSKKQLVDSCRRYVEKDGFQGVKVKVGLPNPCDDIERVEAVRKAIGTGVQLMVDANGRGTLPRAIELARHFEDFGVVWFEEPLWFDDVEGHRRLAEATRVPIALGEQLYTLDAFKAYLDAGAVHYLQPDATRVAGITECLKVADLALAHRLPVALHCGDMMQIHLQLAVVHPAVTHFEYIPWMRECFVEPATFSEGRMSLPQLPGAGTELREDAIRRFGENPD